MKIHHFQPRRGLALTCLAAALASSLVGCGSPQLQAKVDRQVEATIARAKVLDASPPLAEQAGAGVKGGSANADRLAAEQRNAPVTRRASAPYIGSVMVPATSEDRLPSIFHEPFTIDFSDARDGAGGVSLSVAMARLSRMTGVPIRVQADVYSGPGDAGAGGPAHASMATPGAPMPMPSPVLTNRAPFPVPPTQASTGTVRPPAVTASVRQRPDAVSTASPMTVRSVDMKYSGTIAGYLNGVTDRLGLAWEYRDNTVVVMRFVTEIHEVFTVAGSTKYNFGSGGGSSASGGGTGGGTSSSTTSSADVSESGETNVMASLEKAITSMLSEVPGSTVTRSDGSGRLVVKSSREMQSRVRDFIKSENSAMRRQAQIQFDVYSVTVDESDEHGIDWTAALASLKHPALRIAGGAPASLADALAGNVAISILGGQGGDLSSALGNSKLIVQALSEQGYSAQHRPVSLLALNRQWARVSRLGTEYYLSETTPGPASSTGVGAPGLKTDKVTTGDRYVAMPQILDDNTIMLKFDMSLSDLLGLFDVTVGTGATAQKIQAPKLTAVSAQMPVALRPGEVVAITGLSRVVVSNDTRRLSEGAPIGLGGSQKMSTKREHFLIFIRPVIL